MARVFFAVLLLGVATISIQKMSTPPRHVATAVAVPAPPAQGTSLTDDELLALFPDTAVGLITLQNGKKMLVFPNSGDEARFVSRL
jgi:hypothetical protein